MSARLADGRNSEDRENKKLLDPALIRNFSCLKGRKPWRGLHRPDEGILEAKHDDLRPRVDSFRKGDLGYSYRSLAACLAGPDIITCASFDMLHLFVQPCQDLIPSGTLRYTYFFGGSSMRLRRLF